MGIAGTFLGSIDVPHCAQNFHHSRRWYSHAAQVHAASLYCSMAIQMLGSVVSVSSGPALFEATASSGSVSPLSLCNYGLHIHYGMTNRIRTAELPLSFRNAELPHRLLRMLELLSHMLDLRLL